MSVNWEGWKNFVKALKEFWARNLGENVKTVSFAIGAMIVAWLAGLLSYLVTGLQLGIWDMTGMLTVGLTGTFVFLITFTEAFFGKRKNGDIS